ncbi:MAG: nucleotidyltransferase family protein [Pseudomonadota bacterium]
MRKRTARSLLAARADELRAVGVRSLYLFGSTVRSRAGRGSDVDLLVELRDRSRFSLFDLLELRYRAEAILGRRADVVTRESLHPAIKKAVLAEAVRVF